MATASPRCDSSPEPTRRDHARTAAPGAGEPTPCHGLPKAVQRSPAAIGSPGGDGRTIPASRQQRGGDGLLLAWHARCACVARTPPAMTAGRWCPSALRPTGTGSSRSLRAWSSCATALSSHRHSSASRCGGGPPARSRNDNHAAFSLVSACVGPPAGVEPATPSLPALVAATGRNPRQRFALVSVLFGPAALATACHRLQPRGSIKAPSLVVSLDYGSRNRP